MKSLPPDHQIALAHDYFVQMGGAERVVSCFHRFWPEAPIYTSVIDRARLVADLRGADIRTGWMQRLPRLSANFHRYYAIYPFAFLTARPVRAQVMLISASTFAKCLRAAPGTSTICYCHAPTRFLWENHTYLLGGIRSAILRGLVLASLPILRRIDHAAAQRVDVFVANSHYVRAKISQAYGRDALVIYPPVDVSDSEPTGAHAGYYLIVSRLVAYKGIDVAIAACRTLGRQLIIVGEGPDRARLEQLAAGADVTFTGRVAETQLKDYLRNCRAFIFPGQEDFGIAPVEAQGWGKPVLAFGRGGALETVVPHETGLFFAEQQPASLLAVLRDFEARSWDPAAIRRNALRFSPERFEREIRELVAHHLDKQGTANGAGRERS